MNCVILACSSLTEYVHAAQIKIGTHYPVVYLNKALHADPAAMRQSILHKLASMPAEYDTILVAMGFCGGSWKEVKASQRLVRPKVDDCVSLLLHTEATAGYDLKKNGHLYMKDLDPAAFDIEQAFAGYTKDMDAATKAKIKSSWQALYSVVDVVDTGINRTNTPVYKQWAEKNAKWIDGNVEQLTGSNILIEKLVSGDWDTSIFEVTY